MSIKFKEIFEFHDSDQYKVHLASWNGESHPLDVFARDRDEWHDWNRWRDSRDDYNRLYVLSLIDYYSEKNTWLFGGIFLITGSSNQNRSLSYEIQLTDKMKDFIGRLKISFVRPGRARVIKLESYIEKFEVKEILRQEYSGQNFPGYENICHPYLNLEVLYQTEEPEWKSALSSVKGIYLIRDKNSGKCYIGSAYGESGIWGRWSEYIATGHGWSEGMLELYNDKGIEYMRKNLIFSILEIHSFYKDDSKVIDRESYWKTVLGTRENGLNRN